MKAAAMRWGRGDCEAPQAQLDEKFSLPMTSRSRRGDMSGEI